MRGSKPGIIPDIWWAGPGNVIDMAYALAGLRISSELPLQGLTECGDGPSALSDLVIRRSSARTTLSARAFPPNSEWDGERLLIRIEGVADYWVTADSIEFDPQIGSDPRDVAAYLLGTCFGALCHLRGIFPLHASAIETAGACVAFTGDSGAGKSTMIAALGARGHKIITDDVAYVRRGADGQSCVYAGPNRIRLWDSAMDGLGLGREGIERELRGFDKFLLPVDSQRDPRESRRLDAVFQLQDAPAGVDTRIERVRGAAAAEVLLENTYRLGLAEQMGLKSKVFSLCMQLARQVQVYRLERPKDFAALDKVVEAVEIHLRK